MATRPPATPATSTSSARRSTARSAGSQDDANIVDGYDYAAYVEKLETIAREAGA